MSPPEPALWRALLGQPAQLRGLGPQAWLGVLSWASAEGVAGLLYERCVQQGVEVPEPARLRLQASHRSTAARNLQVLHELGEVLTGLARCGAQVVVLPGLCLLPLLPDPGWRPMEDVDVLLPPGAWEATRAALVSLGLRPVRRHPGLLCRGCLVLDLHRDPLDCWRVRARRHAAWIGPQEVWRERRQAEVEGVRMSVPCVEHQLLYTAAHAVKHAFQRLVWFVDLDLLTGQIPDWDGLAVRAQRSGLERALLYGLTFLRQQAGVGVPEPARRWMEARPLRPLERRLLGQAFADRWHGGWGDVLWSLGVRGARRWQFLAETCFPRPAVLLQVYPRLPAVLLPLAYPLRLGQAVGRAALLARRVLRTPATAGEAGEGGT
ncbi:MAG: nucleotidyltransferase family protein [Candidatus Latescibacterota bacterium]